MLPGEERRSVASCPVAAIIKSVRVPGGTRAGRPPSGQATWVYSSAQTSGPHSRGPAPGPSPISPPRLPSSPPRPLYNRFDRNRSDRTNQGIRAAVAVLFSGPICTDSAQLGSLWSPQPPALEFRSQRPSRRGRPRRDARGLPRITGAGVWRRPGWVGGGRRAGPTAG